MSHLAIKVTSGRFDKIYIDRHVTNNRHSSLSHNGPAYTFDVLLGELGRQLSAATRDVRETVFLFQRLSVVSSVTTQFSSTSLW